MRRKPRRTQADLIGDAISALVLMVAAITLAPLSKTLRDQGAAEWFALIFLIMAGVALVGMLYFLYKVVRHGGS